MKTGTTLLLCAGGVLAVYYSKLLRAAGVVDIVFSGVQLQGITDYVISLMFQNVSNATIVVNSVAGTVYVNGNTLASISDFDQVSIPPNSQQEVKFHVNPSLLTLPGVIRDILNMKGSTFVFNIKANANINNIIVPIDLDETVSI
ncbi:MAG: hypothetical protein V4560_11675 [Bacteroidota bacterium]